MTSLTNLTIAEARVKLKAREFSALELTDSYISAIDKAKILNAYVAETPDQEIGRASCRERV